MSNLSLRGRLIVAFVGIVIGALALAAVFGVIRFDRMIQSQAQNMSNTSMRVAEGLLSDEIEGVQTSVSEMASDPVLASGDPGQSGYSEALANRASIADFTYIAVVAADGSVRATSLSTGPYMSAWPQLATWAAAKQTMSGVAIVPQDELERLHLINATHLSVKETPNGTVIPGEERGALAIVGITPLGDQALVGVRVVKLRYDLVDSVVDKMGGTATVFQNGVRIATTVKNEEGQRAIGTVVSDQVREATLEGGEPFKGSAFVVNKEYLASYVPLRDFDDTVVGMLYVGVDKAPYVAATRAFALTFLGVVLVALALAVFGAFNISKALTRPLVAMGGAASQVATGDLTARVPAQGYREVRELGSSFNLMTGGLKTLIAQVDESVRHLRTIAGEISTASRASSENANAQASSVAQTTATLEELTRSFQAVSDGARRVLHVAEDALESAQTGMGTVDKTHDAMGELANGAKDMSAAAVEMDTVSREITEMTSIITGIAGQTKILALNAAIEAARAGEAGKGFAVVSTEIRALAENVAQLAARIAYMVSDIQDASSRFQKSAEQQSSLTDSTLGSSEASRDTFAMIVHQMEDTARAAREIAEATVQQTRASDQLVDAMHQVSVSSRETAAAARQLADSASTVDVEAENLLHSLTRFKTN